MTDEHQLLAMAEEAAVRAQKRAARIEDEYLELQNKAAELRAQLELEKGALDRLAKFKFKLGANLQCPVCWVDRGSQMPLRPVPSVNRDDLFKCDHGHEIVIRH